MITFDDFLKETGIYEEVTARAIKRVIARQLDALMQDQGLTKSALAKRMRTGQVTINGGLHPLLPFGGFKQSGIGREMITAGFETFTELQAISWRS